MNEPWSIDKVRKKHDEFFDTAISGKLQPTNDQTPPPEVEELLEQLKLCSACASSVDDYLWFCVAAKRWQGMYSSRWNIPKTVEISPSPAQLLMSLPADKALSKDELSNWQKRHAEFLGLLRLAQTGRDSTQYEMGLDWHRAQILLASDILDGFPNFAGRIASDSYCWLESIWLKEVKRLRAYFIWQRRGDGINLDYEKIDYDNAVKHIRRMLVNEDDKGNKLNPGIKARTAEFGEAKTYLEDRYLTDGMIVHEGNGKKNANAKTLIDTKARRIQERRKKWEPNYIDGVKNDKINWSYAEIYVKMFYENIIPAVTQNDSEKVLTVLKAFQYSKAPENCWWVINCFETALAIYFLDPETIKYLWNASAKEPQPNSSIESIVPISSWPKSFKVPKECKGGFVLDAEKIMFKGVMTQSQMNALLEKLTEEEHRKKLEELFNQSRLIHEETTL